MSEDYVVKAKSTAGEVIGNEANPYLVALQSQWATVANADQQLSSYIDAIASAETINTVASNWNSYLSSLSVVSSKGLWKNVVNDAFVNAALNHYIWPADWQQVSKNLSKSSDTISALTATTAQWTESMRNLWTCTGYSNALGATLLSNPSYQTGSAVVEVPGAADTKTEAEKFAGLSEELFRLLDEDPIE